MKTVVLFGGTGFIGTHLAQHMLNAGRAETVVLVDRDGPRAEPYTHVLQAALKCGKAVFVRHDIRMPVPPGLLPESAELVVNLAAIHREPGHRPSEYFETNLRGAENICAWAVAANCHTIIFTSSISPYGPSEEKRTEKSLPVPETAYGSSKLAAEMVHLAWQAANPQRRLLILRPGVVFGPGEHGNVTRLVRSLVKGYFVYLGNRKTVKAAGYVKELCQVTTFALDMLHTGDSPTLLLNFTIDPPPTMEQIVEAIGKTIGRTMHPPDLPRWILLTISYPIAAIERIMRMKLPINRLRVTKLTRSNNIWPEGLRALGYKYHYTLESAFEDWKTDLPADFV